MDHDKADPAVDAPLAGGRTVAPTARRKAPRAAGPRGGRRLRRLVQVIACLAVVVGCVGGGLAFRLKQGPVSLAWFKDRIEDAINTEMSGQRITFSDVDIGLADDGVEISFSDIRVGERGGPAIVGAPRAVAGLSASAFLAGRIGLSRVDLVNPRVQITHADDGALAISFAQSGDAVPTAQTPATQSSTTQSSTTQISTTGASAHRDTAALTSAASVGATDPNARTDTAGAINFVQAITDLSARARRHESASSYLREIGLRHATIIFDNGRRKTIWNVPEIQIDLKHRDARSLIAGRGEIESLTGPWGFVFHAEEAVAAKNLVVVAEVHDINPRGLSRQIPALAKFERLDVPLDGDVRINLSSHGVVGGASFELAARPGQIRADTARDKPANVEAGAVKGTYDAVAGKVSITEASLAVEHNHLTVSGTAEREPSLTSNGLPLWSFAFASREGALAPPTQGAAAVPIDTLKVRGQFIPDAGQLLFQDVALSAGGATLSAKGSVSDLATDPSRSADLEAVISPMPLERVLALWPSTLAPAARRWVAGHVAAGQVSAGTMRFASTGDYPISFNVELAGVEIAATQTMPLLKAARALLRLEGGTLEVTIPDATIGSSKQALQLKGVRATIVDTADGSPPVAEVALRVLGPLATALDLADRDPIRLLKSRGIILHGPEGKIDGQVKLQVPLSDATSVADVKLEGRVRIVDGHLKQAIGPHDVTGAKINLEISEAATDVRGELLLKGIPIKIAGQYFANSTPDRQSPFRLNLKLDDADRTQLGLDINDLVAGDIPIEILIGQDAKGDMQAHLTADLTNAELNLDSVSFHKPMGSAASVQFDPVRGQNGRTELKNFIISGRTIAAQGTIVLGADNKPKDVVFPEFSLNTVSRLDIQSHLRADNIWDMRAKGSTFDGRDVFRDLFNVQAQAKAVAKTKPGLDLEAEIDTVVGFSDTNLRNVRLRLQKRHDTGFERTTVMDLTASHENGKPFAAHLRSTGPGHNAMTATSEDAGLTFKAVGFYPNAVGGHMDLDVDLAGQGNIERKGLLKTRNFTVLGDPVVSEVFQTGDGAHAGDGGQNTRKKVVREKFEFDWMEVPFLVGSGQFVMNNAEIRGPLVGARLRGKVDFVLRRMQVGGTYIPLSGLNSAIGGFPVLGQILAGPGGEGIFGFTFLIQGSMASPEVLVNPFSGFVPGILRETQQMAPESFKITPRSDTPPQQPAPAKGATRASSSAPTTTGRSPSAAMPRAQSSDVISDWSSETMPKP